MDVAALILALIAVVLACTARTNLALACVAAAPICQWVHLTGHLVTVN